MQKQPLKYDDVLTIYREDDRLNRFANKLERDYDSSEKIDWNDLIIKDTLEAYWTDIGGEGA
ncbi:MAG: hypothetical protein CME70_22660 [Halobacteriovorax sp.]|nr:hypothetical protein [Halobacteriovorax sp.]